MNTLACMPYIRFSQRNFALALCLVLTAIPSAAKKKNLPAVRWKAGAPGCEFERRDDGRYVWRMVGDDLDISLLMDSQELVKSQHRLYKPLGVYLSVTYTGSGKFEFPADLRMEFVRHHNVSEGFLDPTEFSTRMQNDVDTLVFDTEHEIKKHPEKAEEKTNRAREFQKQVAEFIEFLSTQSLEPAILTPGNPEAHGWVFFGTKNKWLGSWRSREDFILRVWMNDKVWEFPFSMPPTEGDLILRKRVE
jgi:SAM-dependent methyltransferase